MFRGNEKTRNLIVLFVVLAAATVYYFFYSQGGSAMTLAKDGSAVAFRGPKNTAAEMTLDTVTDITYAEVPDLAFYGTSTDGGRLFGGFLYGTWTNDTFGTYQAFLSARVKSCVVLTDPDKTIAFSTENADTTRQVYEQLLQLWEAR